MSAIAGEQPLSLDHLRRLTDCSGVVQHANYALPDYRTGYTTDDNARALVVAVKHYRLHGDQVSRELATRYLAFLMYTHREDGRFHNYIGYDRRPLDEVGSEDCFGRALWSLAWVLFAPPQPGLVGPAERMFHQSLPWVRDLEHPRGKAFCLTALYRWGQARPEEMNRIRELATPIANHLLDCHRRHGAPGWDWLLPDMTYANAKLPEALFRAYQITEGQEFLAIARRTMDFLCEKTFVDGVLCLVGNRGWHRGHEGEPPRYDQQPLDAAAMVDAALAGFDATGEVECLRLAWMALAWFFGRNHNRVPLYDSETGGCFDALMEHGVNQNRGAESTISLLLAQLSVLEARQKISRRALAGEPLPDWSMMVGEAGPRVQ